MQIDPWIVTDHLLARGEATLALLVAKEGGSPSDRGALVEYVSSPKRPRNVATVLAALSSARALRLSNVPEAALARLRSTSISADGVLEVLVLLETAMCLRDLGLSGETDGVHIRAAEIAARLGWKNGLRNALRPLCYAHCLRSVAGGRSSGPSHGGDAAILALQKGLESDEVLITPAVVKGAIVALVVDASSKAFVLADGTASSIAGPPFWPTEAKQVEMQYEQRVAGWRRFVHSLGLRAEHEKVIVCEDPELTGVPWSAILEGRSVVQTESLQRVMLPRDTPRRRKETLLVTARGAPGSAHRQSATLTLTKPTAGQCEEALARGGHWRCVHFVGEISVPSRRFRIGSDLGADTIWLSELRYVEFQADVLVLEEHSATLARLPASRSHQLIGRVASRLIVPRWRSDPAATRYLFARFHTHLQAGEDVAGALRQAQREVAARSAWQHPRFWACWELWGRP